MTLSTLDIRSLKKQGIIYVIISIFCLIFGQVYEIFSHEVYSNYMIYAFLIPLIFGAGVSFALYFIKIELGAFGNKLYNASVATFTCGCIFNRST